jgi:hypothetical protein
MDHNPKLSLNDQFESTLDDPVSVEQVNGRTVNNGLSDHSLNAGMRVSALPNRLIAGTRASCDAVTNEMESKDED